MTDIRDRLSALLAPGTTRNGIDYVELVPGTPPRLRVHFHTDVAVALSDPPSLTGGDRVPVVPIAPVLATDWSADAQGRRLLMLRPVIEGDSSTYTLRLAAPSLDSRYATAPVSFRVFCPSDFDCAPDPHACPDEDVALPAIDYLAKDFESFRQLLIDDAAQRYPLWVERSEADFALVLIEAMSALADELSYQQDRIAGEASFATARSRHALIQHARLIDHEPEPPRSARTELMLAVAATSIAAGTRIDGTDADGRAIPFEIGEGLHGPVSYPADPRWNWPLSPWWWDDAERCLPCGATEMWIAGDGHGLVPSIRLLIQTDLPGESIRQIVTLTAADPDFDALFPPGTGTPLTRLRWAATDALRREHDLTRTQLGGNILPATQGEMREQRFVRAGPGVVAPTSVLRAIEREGSDPTGEAIVRLPLADAPLAWVPGATRPELVMEQVAPAPRAWDWVRTLLDADPLDTSYTVDPLGWRVVTRNGDASPRHWEPDGEGASIRFGDGVFGLPPEPGAEFAVRYRTTLGPLGNLPADSIGQILVPGAIVSARNPFASAGGAAAESAERIRRVAPMAYRAHRLNAVRAEDYVTTARELDWVQDAACRFRWTGSWHSAFTTADPLGGSVTTLDQERELIALLQRRRLAGVESIVPEVRYVSVDLEIEICVAAGFRADEVERRVLQALIGQRSACGGRVGGFFFADHFSFGAPLYRARLEDAVMAVAGVKGVLDIRYRRPWNLSIFQPLPPVLEVGAGEILRIDSDPDWPERGTIRVYPEGGL